VKKINFGILSKKERIISLVLVPVLFVAIILFDQGVQIGDAGNEWNGCYQLEENEKIQMTVKVARTFNPRERKIFIEFVHEDYADIPYLFADRFYYDILNNISCVTIKNGADTIEIHHELLDSSISFHKVGDVITVDATILLLDEDVSWQKASGEYKKYKDLHPILFR